MRPRSKSWPMTAKGSGLHRSGFPKGVFGGGRPGLGRLEHWRRTKCSSCWPRAIRTRKPRRYGAESLEAKRKKTSTRGLRSRVFSGTLLSMRAEWRYRGRTVTAAEVVFIRQLIAAHPGASRRRLSHKLCEAWEWNQANGAPRDMVCRGLLLMLHRSGAIELPPVRYTPPNPLAKRQPPVAMLIDTTPIQGRLSQLQPIEFQQVRRTGDEALFNSLMEQHHYL